MNTWQPGNRLWPRIFQRISILFVMWPMWQIPMMIFLWRSTLLLIVMTPKGKQHGYRWLRPIHGQRGFSNFGKSFLRNHYHAPGNVSVYSYKKPVFNRFMIYFLIDSINYFLSCQSILKNELNYRNSHFSGESGETNQQKCFQISFKVPGAIKSLTGSTFALF